MKKRTGHQAQVYKAATALLKDLNALDLIANLDNVAGAIPEFGRCSRTWPQPPGFNCGS